MYHIKKDKRSQDSANALYTALIKMLKNEEKVSITQLVKNAQVGRSTFYRNFDEPIDILQWKAESYFKQVLTDYVAEQKEREEAGEGEPDSNSLIRYVFEFWSTRSDVLEALMRLNRIDLIYEAFQKASPIVLDYLADKNEIKGMSKRQVAYFSEMRTSIFIGTMATWLRGGKKESGEEIAQMLADSVDQLTKMKVLF